MEYRLQFIRTTIKNRATETENERSETGGGGGHREKTVKETNYAHDNELINGHQKVIRKVF